jgi:hypothetical protein
MRLPKWLRRRNSPRPTFRPTLGRLEDRVVPSGLPATHLQVIVPDQVYTGKSFKVLVEAETASNHLALGYTGTVTLSLGTPDSGALLPNNPYTFTAGNYGLHVFKVTLQALGSQTIDATGTIPSGTIIGTATTTVDPTPVATSFNVIAPANAATGAKTPVTVEVLDQSGNPFFGYTGTVSFANTSDSTATVAATHRGTQTSISSFTYTFTPYDHGVHTFFMTFNTPSPPTTTVDVMDTTNTNIFGQTAIMVFPSSTVTHFGIFAVPFAVSGTATPVLVVALNASNQVVPGYMGTVTFTSGDTTATVAASHGGPATSIGSFSYQFTGTDAGAHLFFVTFDMTGKQSLTVTDATNTGTTQVYVSAQPSWLPWWL